jgi:hypothetical protein
MLQQLPQFSNPSKNRSFDYSGIQLQQYFSILALEKVGLKIHGKLLQNCFITWASRNAETLFHLFYFRPSLMNLRKAGAYPCGAPFVTPL